MLLRKLFAPLMMAFAAAVASSADLPSCPGLSIKAKGKGRGRVLTPGKRLAVSITVKNKGSTATHGLVLSLTSSVATDWRASGKVLPTVDGTTVTWLDQSPRPHKTRRYKLRGDVCRLEGDVVAGGPQTIAEVAVFGLDAEGNAVCMTSAPPLTVSFVAPRGVWPGEGARAHHL
jgi:hypothetical protein